MWCHQPLPNWVLHFYGYEPDRVSPSIANLLSYSSDQCIIQIDQEGFIQPLWPNFPSCVMQLQFTLGFTWFPAQAYTAVYLAQSQGLQIAPSLHLCFHVGLGYF